jgi:hypothetical protein
MGTYRENYQTLTVRNGLETIPIFEFGREILGQPAVGQGPEILRII